MIILDLDCSRVRSKNVDVEMTICNGKRLGLLTLHARLAGLGMRSDHKLALSIAYKIIMPIQFSADQTKVIEAVVDTFFANLSPDEQSNIRARQSKALTANESIELLKFMESSGSDLNASDDFKYLTSVITADKQFLLSLVLQLLATPAGTMILCGGGFKSFQPFFLLSRPEREAALVRIGNSRIPKIRFIFSSFMALSMFCT